MKNSDVLAAAEPNDNQPPKKENEPIVSRWKVDGSNYTHIYKDGKHFLTIKNYKVTEDFNSAEELKEYMENSWMELMTRTMVTMYGICKDMEKTQEPTTEILK